MAADMTGPGTASAGPLSSLTQRARGAHVSGRRSPLDGIYLSQLIPTLLILVISVANMWVCSLSLENASFTSHLAGIAIGLVAAAAMWRYDYRALSNMTTALFVLACVLMALPRVPGLGLEGGLGGLGWVRLGPLRFQPSEVAKVAVILFFATRLSKRDTEKKKKWSRRTLTGRTLERLDRIGFLELVPYGAILMVIALLMLMEPHMSGTILVLAGGASVLFAAGISLGWFAAGGTLVAGAMWFIITQTPYMTARINLWLDPWAQRQGDGFQTVQSLLAIGSGGLLGLGLGKSRQKFLYVPEPENDFVFPIVAEELGFIGAVVVLLLFSLLIMRGYWLALHARDKFGALTIVGIITLLAVQVFLNVGVVTNLIPNTGISLPFFSYGGTALLIQLAEMGIVLSISRQIPAPKND